MTRAELDGEDPEQASAAAQRPVYLLRLEPGAAPPDGVAPDARRYDLAVETHHAERLRTLVHTLGWGLAIASLSGVFAHRLWWLAALPAGIALTRVPLKGPGSRIVLVPSTSGAFVEADGMEPEVSDDPPASLPLIPLWLRVLMGVGAAALLADLVFSWGEVGLQDGVVSAIAVLALGGAAVLGGVHLGESLAPWSIRSQQRFSELADPARPLTDDDLRPSRATVSSPDARTDLPPPRP